MSNTQYRDLIELLTTQFASIDRRFERIEKRLDQHDRQFDLLFKEILAFRQEFTVSSFRIGRIESWVKKAAKKIELPYNT